MSKTKNQPVADIVHEIMEVARAARGDGPHSGLYGRNAQLSNAITHAGVTLAKVSGPTPAKRTSVLQHLWSAQAAKPKQRSWIFSGRRIAPAAPDAKRIEQMLRASAGQGRRLVLDRELVEGHLATNDWDCTLPEGAVDPVCAPRR